MINLDKLTKACALFLKKASEDEEDFYEEYAPPPPQRELTEEELNKIDNHAYFSARENAYLCILEEHGPKARMQYSNGLEFHPDYIPYFLLSYRQFLEESKDPFVPDQQIKMLVDKWKKQFSPPSEEEKPKTKKRRRS